MMLQGLRRGAATVVKRRKLEGNRGDRKVNPSVVRLEAVVSADMASMVVETAYKAATALIPGAVSGASGLAEDATLTAAGGGVARENAGGGTRGITNEAARGKQTLTIKPKRTGYKGKNRTTRSRVSNPPTRSRE